MSHPLPANSLEIPAERLEQVNYLLSDPNSSVMHEFSDVVRKYGTPMQINALHAASRTPSALRQQIADKQPAHLADLDWLAAQIRSERFVSIHEFLRANQLPLPSAQAASAGHPVTLEVSALQYFPWVRAMAEEAIAQRSLVPSRFIAVRKMKESADDGDLPAIVLAMDMIGASFVETLDTKGTDGSNPHLGGPDTITGYFGGIGQPNDHALMWVDEFLHYYTRYGVQHVLNFNAGTILLGFLLYKLGIDIQFKISVFFGSDNPYHALWILMAAKLFSRDDGTTPLIGFNWSNSIDNTTLAKTSDIRAALGFTDVVRFEHHITETWRSIVKQPYDRTAELLQIAKTVPNISAKHEGGLPSSEALLKHPSDILDYFRDKQEVIASGDWDALRNNFLLKVKAANATARALAANGTAFVAAPNLHR